MRRLIVLAFCMPAWLFLSYNCSKKISTGSNVTITPPNTDSSGKSFLALGDSYTIGQSVDITLRFPAQTASWLTGNGLRVKTPQYIATTGWTTINLQNAIQQADLRNTFDIVSLLIGVNDQYQHLDTSGYRIRFEQLLQTSIQLAGNQKAHVFVLSIPDYSVTPFAQGSNTAQISKEIDWFNNINRQITEQYRCHYLYITQLTRAAATDASLLAPDGLHPSGKEYKIWADSLAPVIKAALQ